MTTPSDRSGFWPAIATTAFLAAVIVLLHVEGRSFICNCGRYAFWIGDTCSSSTSQHLFDPYSFTHVLHGFLFFWLLSLWSNRIGPTWQFSLAVLLEGVWEVFENTRFVIEKYRTETAALGYQGDTIANSLGAVACAMVGFLVARQLGVRRSLVVFVLIEVVLILWIHDSLLLQIVMLVRPVEGIKLWQMCAP